MNIYVYPRYDSRRGRLLHTVMNQLTEEGAYELLHLFRHLRDCAFLHPRGHYCSYTLGKIDTTATIEGNHQTTFRTLKLAAERLN